MITPEQEQDLLELTINKIKKLQNIVPKDHNLNSILSSHLSSLLYTPPEAIYFRLQLIANSLSSELGQPDNENWENWKQQTYDIWTKWPNFEEVDEPTELENDIDFSDCDITLLSQKDGDSHDI